jgi:hypothetical protein
VGLGAALHNNQMQKTGAYSFCSHAKFTPAADLERSAEPNPMPLLTKSPFEKQLDHIGGICDN